MPIGGLALGLDFGTESARALVVDMKTGAERGVAVADYPHGVIDQSLPDSSIRLPPEWALQHPGDYLEVLERIIPEAMAAARAEGSDIAGIGLDFTSCTMLPTLADGTPLCLVPGYREEPHAWVKLWKHHAASPQAEAINRVAAKRGEAFLQRYGGRTSSEWLFAKIWQVLAEAPEIYAATEVFVEAADWTVWQLTGSLVRNACCAGYKGMWSREEGYPSAEFLTALDPRLADLTETRLRGNVVPVGDRAGFLTPRAAKRFGLPPGIPVATPIIDAHAAVPAGGITGPGVVLIVMGTSTCHMALGETGKVFDGVAGVVQDGILPGFTGYEAGQSATGDIYAWFVENCVPAAFADEARLRRLTIHQLLEERAAALRVGESGVLALDWWNGNRSVLMDSSLSGLLVGMSLDTRPEEIYRALIEATAFGTRVILENFERNGVPVTRLVACGGLAEKNELLMQIHADICGRPIRVVRSAQASALGAAIFGAVAAGASRGGYDDVATAALAMGGLKDVTYHPRPRAQQAYDQLFKEYLRLHDLFGRGGLDVMKRLREMKSAALTQRPA